MNIEHYKTLGKFIGTSGIKLTEYYDFMGIFEISSDLRDVLKYMETYLPANVIGIELFGAMIVSALTGKLHRPLMRSLYFLKERTHGNRKRLYGNINIDLPTIIIDDMITRGGTVKEVIEYLKIHHDIKVDKIIVIKSRLEEINGIKITQFGE